MPKSTHTKNIPKRNVEFEFVFIWFTFDCVRNWLRLCHAGLGLWSAFTIARFLEIHLVCIEFKRKKERKMSIQSASRTNCVIRISNLCVLRKTTSSPLGWVSVSGKMKSLIALHDRFNWISSPQRAADFKYWIYNQLLFSYSFSSFLFRSLSFQLPTGCVYLGYWTHKTSGYDRTSNRTMVAISTCTR